MDLTFESSNGKEFKMEVWFFDSILEIKKKIEKCRGIPTSNQILIFNNQTLEDNKDTEVYGILHGSRIKLLCRSDVTKATKAKVPAEVILSVTISQLKKRLSIECEATDTISQVKKKVQESENIPVSKMALYLGGQEMMDQRTLAEYGVSVNSEISVAIKKNMMVQNSNNNVGGSKKMKVLVLTKCGTNRIAVEVNPYENVSMLKKELQKVNSQLHLNLPQDGYFFIYKQNVMDDNRSFKWHDVRPGDTIEMFNGSVTGGT